jgi:P-type Ca2+ transporter type 2C
MTKQTAAQTETAEAIQGLTATEVTELQVSQGFNELPRTAKRTAFRIILEVVREPMLALLLAGGAIYLVLGSLEEALILLAFALLSVFITVIQEARTEKVLDALRDLSSPRALVIRDGERRRIAGREVVRGDVMILAEGDRVPADALLIEADDLQTDESLLTGESVPVHKIADATGTVNPALRPGGDNLPCIYSGSLVVRGNGMAVVTAIGANSEIGRIGHSLSKLETESPRLQNQIRKLVRIAGLGGALISAFAVVLYGLLRGGWLDALLVGIALGMSMLPEEFPVVLAVFMAMGAWRISQAQVLTRRATAIESLGAATVLCTDKTGTLTQNIMTIAGLRLANGAGFDTLTESGTQAGTTLPLAFCKVLDVGVLASAKDPFDPMDKAFHALQGQSGGAGPSANWQLKHSYGLRRDLLAVAQLWSSANKQVVAAKGAPEAIAELCHMSPAQRARLKRAVDEMAAKGMRVLGIAEAPFKGSKWPASPRGFKFRFTGLAGLSDPLRESVPDAIRLCRSAGIRVIMITGDYPVTARSIAQQAGLATDTIITGQDLDLLDDDALATALKTATVFARIMPEQKLRIVEALKRQGEVVAMTGDGVNDAPSLKAAHVGIAMGGRGTDVAREASSIVLLKDDFGSIVKAIQLGRRIYDNLQKAMGFIFAVHVPIAGLALLPLLFGLPILFGPVHIAFLELVIDPVCSLVFEAEAEEDNVMSRPPRPTDAPLFSFKMVVWSIFQGFVALVLVGGIYLLALYQDMPDNEVRALTFFSLVLSIVGLIFVNRSFSSSALVALRRHNIALLRVLTAVTAMLAATLLWPEARRLFRFGPLHLNDLAVVLGAGVFVLIFLEAMKGVLVPRQTAEP